MREVKTRNSYGLILLICFLFSTSTYSNIAYVRNHFSQHKFAYFATGLISIVFGGLLHYEKKQKNMYAAKVSHFESVKYKHDEIKKFIDEVVQATAIIKQKYSFDFLVEYLRFKSISSTAFEAELQQDCATISKYQQQLHIKLCQLKDSSDDILFCSTMKNELLPRVQELDSLLHRILQEIKHNGVEYDLLLLIERIKFEHAELQFDQHTTTNFDTQLLHPHIITFDTNFPYICYVSKLQKYQQELASLLKKVPTDSSLSQVTKLYIYLEGLITKIVHSAHYQDEVQRKPEYDRKERILAYELEEKKQRMALELKEREARIEQVRMAIERKLSKEKNRAEELKAKQLIASAQLAHAEAQQKTLEIEKLRILNGQAIQEAVTQARRELEVQYANLLTDYNHAQKRIEELENVSRNLLNQKMDLMDRLSRLGV